MNIDLTTALQNVGIQSILGNHASDAEKKLMSGSREILSPRGCRLCRITSILDNEKIWLCSVGEALGGVRSMTSVFIDDLTWWDVLKRNANLPMLQAGIIRRICRELFSRGDFRSVCHVPPGCPTGFIMRLLRGEHDEDDDLWCPR